MSPAAATSSSLNTFLNRKAFVPCGLMFQRSPCLRSLVHQVQSSRRSTRDEAKPYPCFKYSELKPQAVGSTFVSGALTSGALKEPKHPGKTGENSPHLLREHEGKRK